MLIHEEGFYRGLPVAMWYLYSLVLYPSIGRLSSVPFILLDEEGGGDGPRARDSSEGVLPRLSFLAHILSCHRTADSFFLAILSGLRIIWWVHLDIAAVQTKVFEIELHLTTRHQQHGNCETALTIDPAWVK
jgi:hypothetical protein